MTQQPSEATTRPRKQATTTFLLPQVNQDDVDASLVENSAVVSAISPVGSTMGNANEDVSIERKSSLTIGESHVDQHTYIRCARTKEHGAVPATNAWDC